ncbi:AAA family ATPase [Sandaracinus amylolyticus]|uniref:Adenylate cyclase n=1 Tax=Sandaracinus amylolyticus TaxID=927083 RepID=A0A0F6VYM4_9BACT|nr:AAA family ATPase [Sandaracinus amylolyticus]AKF02930.1 Adenylate cyclase [Sandaracinus amylolyticus]
MRRLHAARGATYFLDESGLGDSSLDDSSLGGSSLGDSSAESGPLLVKVLDAPATTQAQLELENELRLTRELAIPGVRRAIRRGEVDGRPALWTTFFAGDTLERAFSDARQPLERVLEVGVRLADVLGALHAARIVHGHLSPRAIRVDATFRDIELSRLGLASRLDVVAEPEGLAVAASDRAAYAAPEETGRMNRPVDWRADLYSLGAILYEMLTGAPALSAPSALELVHRLIATAPTPPHERDPQIPAQVSAIVLKLLAKNAEDRYQSAEGLRVDLARCLDHVRRGDAIPTFALAERDVSARFRLTRRLYGRDAELAALRDAIDRIAAPEGGVELVLLAGRAGTGKSMLVREIERPLTARHGRFIEGKFDQYQREVPFSALSRAFEQWVHLVLAEDDAELARQRARILDAASDLGGLLTRLVPDLELVIGTQPAVPEVGPSEALHRFQYVLRRFLASVADSTRPLVLFVDDLQWADSASLELLGTLATSGDARHLLIVGAYRDDEVPTGHPLTLLLDSLGRSSARVTRIAIGPLAHDAIEQLVADTLSDTPAQVRPLATHVAGETAGNALFVGQLLRAMVDEGTLAWSHAAARWEWSLDGREGTRRDVLDLIVAKVRRLPDATRELLVTCACLGTRVDASVLAQLTDRTAIAVATLLEPALREGVLLATGAGHRFLEAGLEIAGDLEAGYVFPHDRVQQAVYSLVPEGEREALHLGLGRRLAGALGATDADDRIFDVVHQLNRGRARLLDRAERRDLARLDLHAGLVAKRSAAYAAALEYLTIGIELLGGVGGDVAWSTDRPLALQLHTEAAECAYLSSAIDRMEQHIDAVLAQAAGASILETIRVYNLRVDAYTSQNRLNDAMKVGLEALAQLGVRFPREPKLPHVLAGLARTKLTLVGKDVPKLATQRRMTDPHKLEAMLLLERMVPPAYMSGSPLFPLLVFAMVDLSVKYGNSPLSPFGYGSFAITLSGVLGDIRSGEVFGRTALTTMRELGAETYLAKVYFVLYVFITHWTQHLSTCVDPLLDAYHSGMKAGNLVGATWSAYYRLLWMHYCGRPLAELEREAATYSTIFAQLEQNAAFRRCDMLRQTLLNLMGRSAHPIEFRGETYDDGEIETLTAKGDDATSRFFFHSNKVMLGYLFDRADLAVQHGDRAKTLLESATGLPDTPYWTFWDALARARASESARGKRSKTLLAEARAHAAKLAKWGRFAPMNYQHKHDLVAAEIARIESDHTRARELYDQAIEGATTHGYVQEAALACELAARFHRGRARRELATWYLRRAHEGYLRWGAIAKADALEAAFPELAAHGHEATHDEPQHVSADIDLASVVKATTAISGEIVLDRLAATLLEIAVENAGAQRGALVLWEDNEGRVVARKDATGAVSTGLDLAIASAELPETAIAYVARSKRALVVGDALTETRFARDPHVLGHSVRSMLCMPIVHQGALRAIVYLENNLAPDAFTPERLTLLGVLGGQIAISLDNAKLYRNLETALDKQTQLTQAYSRFTPKAFLDFLGAESILDVRLGDQRHGDMTVLFADIRSYTSLSESMSPDDNFRFINGFLSRMTPVIGEHGGVVSDFLGDGVMAFFPREPEDALRAAIAMQRALRGYNEERRAKARMPITMGIGMHTGPLMIGVIGDRDRMDAALVSDTVNTAARMEGLTKELRVSIAASESTIARVDRAFERFGLRRVGDIRPKGKSQVVRVYECFDGDVDAGARAKRDHVAEFEAALAAFQRAEFADASDSFEKLLAAYEHDATAHRYLERAKEYRARGVPEGWSGVEAMERK